MMTYHLQEITSSKDPVFKEALQIYVEHTHPDIRTDPTMICYWVDRYNKTFDDCLHLFAFQIDGVVAGFCQAVALNQSNVVVIDYITLAPNFRKGLHPFLVFAQKVFENLQSKYPTHHLLVEAMNLSGKGLIKLLARCNLHPLPYPYLQPVMEQSAGHPEEGVLLKWSPTPNPTLSIDDYKEIIASIFKDHYQRWYQAYPHFELEKYEVSLFSLQKTLYQKIKEN